MNSISIVQCVYKENPYIVESLKLNLKAIKNSNLINDYEYIIFNDKGDKSIYDSISDIVENDKNITYIYSDINFGKKKCRGGWIGSIPHVSKDLIHLTDQDDVMTHSFYDMCLKEFENKDIDLVTTNGIRVNEKLCAESVMINPEFDFDYSNPIEAFKFWYGIGEKYGGNNKNEVTRANNNFLGPGTIYRTKLHDIIGLPNLDEYEGAADLEYWSRVLFNERKCCYIKNPLWLYRISEYSAGLEVIDGKQNNEYHRKLALEKIKEKYFRLWNEKKTLMNTTLTT
tara:strand:- start:9118 stop:9969 length:852 start_codon:yes stop_codon:yes gene_type:complete